MQERFEAYEIEMDTFDRLIKRYISIYIGKYLHTVCNYII